MPQYISNSDANTYFTERFNSPLWNTKTEAEKTAALATATRIIDTLNFEGEKTDEAQELEFPRGGDTTIPVAIQYACCEIAYCLFDGYDPEYNLRNLHKSQQAFDTNREVRDTKRQHPALTHGIPSIVAWDFLRPFLRDGSTITLSRVD